ncbi:MAG: sugar phosphate isomerase/epimerase [Saprospiraceae bacterium]
MIKRRDFIKNTSLGTIAISAGGDISSILSKKKPHILSLQLYSVRDAMGKDPKGTIKALSKIGYKDCEHASYNNAKRQFYGYAPADWKMVLKDNGMTMKSGHTVFGKDHYNMSTKEVTDLWKTTVEDAVKVGQEYIISPSLDINLRKKLDDLKKFLEGFNAAGAYCKSQGIKYGYHNHDFEFNSLLEGELVMDIIMKNTDPDLVAQQIDIGNMYNGGGKAMDFLKKYPTRYELMHVKDEIKSANNANERYESAILGTGIIGVKDIIKYARKHNNTFYLIIEQESYQGMDPVDSMKKDFDIMKAWGY